MFIFFLDFSKDIIIKWLAEFRKVEFLALDIAANVEEELDLLNSAWEIIEKYGYKFSIEDITNPRLREPMAGLFRNHPILYDLLIDTIEIKKGLRIQKLPQLSVEDDVMQNILSYC